jgi:hypothetical protein
MKIHRLLLLVAALGLFASCESPTVPRFPEEVPDSTVDPDPPKTKKEGLLLIGQDGFFV